MRIVFLSLAFFALTTAPLAAQDVIIQENETGFCSVDGAVMTSVAGYSGSGYADTDRGVGKSMSWNVKAASAGTVSIPWRYGNGGGSGDRPARPLPRYPMTATRRVFLAYPTIPIPLTPAPTSLLPCQWPNMSG
jgi:hypothetical protein